LRECTLALSLGVMKKIILIGVLLLAVTACAANPASSEATPVEVWTGGDDGLTQRLRVALETALDSSPEFARSYGKKPGTLIVLIPTHVGWNDVGDRTQVLYKVEFRTATDHLIAKAKGSCWDNNLAECAAQIVKRAKKAARKV
jgi:hypothetical protein